MYLHVLWSMRRSSAHSYLFSLTQAVINKVCFLSHPLLLDFDLAFLLVWPLALCLCLHFPLPPGFLKVCLNVYRLKGRNNLCPPQISLRLEKYSLCLEMLNIVC